MAWLLGLFLTDTLLSVNSLGSVVGPSVWWISALSSALPDIQTREELEREIFSNLAFGELFREHFERLPSLEGKRVLEIGSGAGQESVLFALNGAEVVGYDKRSTAIRDAYSLAEQFGVREQCTFEVAQVDQLPDDENSFDLVFSKSVLQYTDRPRVIAECIRVLKPGGTLLMIENTPYNPFVNFSRFVRRLKARESDMVYLRTIKGYLHCSEARGVVGELDGGTYRCMHVLTPPIIFMTWSSKLGKLPLLGLGYRVLRAIDKVLLGIIPPLRHLAWIGCMQGNKQNPAQGSEGDHAS